MTAADRAERDEPTGVRGHLMTMRVTRFRDGRVIERRDTVRITAGDPLEPVSTLAWPPCQCPQHRNRE
ncbi:hypothetical protein SUDANB58_02365 [Streptomyces sp. enrichment culture]|uniref:hypothetical protein n=1 Tax=Streptomyces sp. enrichment culture TaxID=1795815 RepID=UPI003F5694E7